MPTGGIYPYPNSGPRSGAPFVSIDYSFTGGFFKEDPDNVVDQFVEVFEKQIADYGVDLVRNRMSSTFRYSKSRPTGYARSRVATTRIVEGLAVADNNAIYGAWLEGTSNRNNASRFKGYRIFRQVTQQLQDRAVKMGDVIFAPYLRRMGGG